jgi:hypothetical protein
MHKWKAAIAFFVCVLTTLTFVSATQITANKSYFPLPADNATIVLLKGASYYTDGASLDAGNYSEGHLYSWYFPGFSMGNGTMDLRVFANNCNVTIASYNGVQTMISYEYTKVSSWLNCTVAGKGTQSLDYLSGNSTVYIDGMPRQQGDGWSSTDLGVTVTGATSKISIYSESTYWNPPRNPPHLSPGSIVIGIIEGALLVAAIIGIIIMALLFVERHFNQPRIQK